MLSGRADDWGELGIEPTQDVRAVKRAYAGRLKQTRPDEDPAGFQRLRAAYEAILAALAQSQPAEIPAPPPAPEPAPEPSKLPQPDTELVALRRQLQEILSQTDSRPMFRQFVAFPGRLMMPLEDLTLAELRLANIAAVQSRLDPDEFIAMAQFFGWAELGSTLSRLAPGLQHRITRRLQAIVWYKQVSAIAGQWTPTGVCIAARLLCSRCPRFFYFIFAPNRALSALMRQYQYHVPALPALIDPKRAAFCQALVRTNLTARILQRGSGITASLTIALLAFGLWFGVASLLGTPNPAYAVLLGVLGRYLFSLSERTRIYTFLGLCFATILLVLAMVAQAPAPSSAPAPVLPRSATPVAPAVCMIDGKMVMNPNPFNSPCDKSFEWLKRP